MPAENRSSKMQEYWVDVLTIEDAIGKYKKAPLTPELVNNTWAILWQKWGKRINHTFNIPFCNFTSKELGDLRSFDRGVLLMPDEVYTPEGLIFLGRMFPEITSQVVGGKSIVNCADKGGCIAIDMDIDPQYMPVSEMEALKYAENIKQVGKLPQRLSTYLIGSKFSSLLTRKHFDSNGTSSFLPGSRWKCDDRILLVHSYGKGDIIADIGLGNNVAHNNWGVRSEWYKN